jgi:hypothetical protein
MFTTISSFNEIKLENPNTLVICDIDNTLIYWDKKKEDFYQIIQEDFSYFTPEKIEKEATDYFDEYVTINPPKITDSEGFDNLIQKIKLLHGSNLIFLTARYSNISNNNIFTRMNFESIGLNYDDFTVHYTNNKISKGKYIFRNIELKKYNEIIFIDDYEPFIKSVKDILPFVNCYKFQIIY